MKRLLAAMAALALIGCDGSPTSPTRTTNPPASTPTPAPTPTPEPTPAPMPIDAVTGDWKGQYRWEYADATRFLCNESTSLTMFGSTKVWFDIFDTNGRVKGEVVIELEDGMELVERVEGRYEGNVLRLEVRPITSSCFGLSCDDGSQEWACGGTAEWAGAVTVGPTRTFWAGSWKMEGPMADSNTLVVGGTFDVTLE